MHSLSVFYYPVSLINFFHLLTSIPFSLFSCQVQQSFSDKSTYTGTIYKYQIDVSERPRGLTHLSLWAGTDEGNSRPSGFRPRLQEWHFHLNAHFTHHCEQVHCDAGGATAHRWRGGATGRALDLRSTGRGFKSYSGQKLRNNIRQVVHTYVPLSPNSITWYRPRGGDVLRLGK